MSVLAAAAPIILLRLTVKSRLHVRLLNEKGYKTKDCCSGHAQSGMLGYIAFLPDAKVIDALFDRWFASEFKTLEELPRCAELNLPDTPASYRIYFEKRRSIIRFEPRRRVSNKAMVQEKPALLAALMNWIKSLPEV